MIPWRCCFDGAYPMEILFSVFVKSVGRNRVHDELHMKMNMLITNYRVIGLRAHMGS